MSGISTMVSLIKLTLLTVLYFMMTQAYAASAQYKWTSSESAPKGVLLQIVYGDLISPDHEAIYVPNGVALHNGWGGGRSHHITGNPIKPLPERLKIRFFSYNENKFYEGDFKLPYERIVALFEAGYESPDEGKVTYREIIVGIAPGGGVSVWLHGFDRTTEVFFGQASEVEGDWGWINRNPNYTREEYIRLGIEESLSKEEQEVLRTKGVPTNRWHRYHEIRYKWYPSFENIKLENNIVRTILYFNGEEDSFFYTDEAISNPTERALPSEMHFIWSRPSKKMNKILKYTFDPEEIYRVFEKLGKGGEPLKLEVVREKVDKQHLFYLSVKNNKEQIRLNNVISKVFSSPK